MPKQPSKGQILLLEEYLRELYLNKLKSFEKLDSFEKYKNSSYIDWLKLQVENPLNIGTDRFHANRVELLDIEEGFPIAHRNERGEVIGVQLRPITDNQKVKKGSSWSDIAKKNILLPRKLLIGCGNNPTTICYHFPHDKKEYINACREYFMDDAKIIIKQAERDWETGKNHLHRDYITLDMNISMNPTVVAEFSENKLEFLPEKYFEIIAQEGISLPNKCKIELDRIGVNNYKFINEY